MASSFILKNQPLAEILRDLKSRHREIDLGAVESYRALIILANRLRDSFDLFLARYGTSQGKASVLVHLSGHAQASLTPSELAQRLGVTRATVTGLIDGLEREGLVRRARAGSADRRCVAVRLAPKGRKLVERFLPPHCRRIGAVMAGLSAAERETLVTLLGKIASALSSL
jgi:DNA-binding MarR family transcriptional regulator